MLVFSWGFQTGRQKGSSWRRSFSERVTFQMKHWFFLPTLDGAAFSSGKEDSQRLEEPFAHLSSWHAPFFFIYYSPEDEHTSPRRVCVTCTEKLHRSFRNMTILKQQRQVTAGAIHKNRNTPVTAYNSLFSLAHKSPKLSTGTKDSMTVQLTREALLQMIMLMPPLWLTKECLSIQLSKVPASINWVYSNLLSQRAICWHSEADSQDHLPKCGFISG